MLKKPINIIYDLLCTLDRLGEIKGGDKEYSKKKLKPMIIAAREKRTFDNRFREYLLIINTFMGGSFTEYLSDHVGIRGHKEPNVLQDKRKIDSISQKMKLFYLYEELEKITREELGA